MSDATATQSQPTATEPDNSPESWAAAENPVEEVVASSETDGEQPAVPQEAAAEEQPAAEAEDNDPPPDFWSAERKALWTKITDPEVRAAIKGHVEDASKAISSKMEEAAKARKAAEEAAKQHQTNQEQLAAWWQQNSPRISQMVQGKWAGVDWNTLSAENPAEWARLRQQYESEMGSLREMQARHDAEVKATETRRQQAHQQERLAEHQKLAAKYPAEFGEGKAQETYNTLSKFVLDHGIAQDRLPGIYEAGVVEIIRKAYKYDQLQAKAKEVTTPKSPAQAATTTPTRIQPGAANRTANPDTESQRQAIQQLRNSGRHNLTEVADAFR